MDQRRDQILEQAINLFLRYGYRKTTMIDVAKAVGISRPTLYAVYPDKESILRDLVDSRRSAYEVEAKKRIATARSRRERIQIPFNIWVLEPYAAALKSPDSVSIVQEAEESAPEAMRSLWKSFEASLAEIMSDSRRVKERSVPIPALVQICSAACRDCKKQNLSMKELEKITEALVTICLEH